MLPAADAAADSASAAMAESSPTRTVFAFAISASSAHRAGSTAGYAISTSSATPAITFASPTLATVSPTAPDSICIRASSVDLCVLVCGRRFSRCDLA